MIQFSAEDWRRSNRKFLFLPFLQKPHAEVTGKYLRINERTGKQRTSKPGRVGI